MTAKELLARVRQEIDERLPGVRVKFGIRISVDDIRGDDGNLPASIRWFVFADRRTSEAVHGYMQAAGSGTTTEDALEQLLHGPCSLDQLAGADDKALAKIDL